MSFPVKPELDTEGLYDLSYVDDDAGTEKPACFTFLDREVKSVGDICRTLGSSQEARNQILKLTIKLIMGKIES